MKIGDNMNMNVDYRVGCTVKVHHRDNKNRSFDVICYGLVGSDIDVEVGAQIIRSLERRNINTEQDWLVPVLLAQDQIVSPYIELSRGGRRPGRPVELEHNKHFFTKHMGRSYHDVQDRGDPVRAARLPVEASSLNRLEQAASQETRNSGGHRDSVEQAGDGRQASCDAKD